VHDLSKRFGNLINGSDDIRTHRFFKSIDLKHLEKKQLTPPYLPPNKDTWAKSKREVGLRTTETPEYKNNSSNPEVKPANDIFLKWF
jgi:hypothetical protein